MKKKSKKSKQKDFVKKNVDHYIELLKTRFMPEYDTKYVKELKKICSAFNYRLTREEKLLFCKKCNCYWNKDTRIIRVNSDTKATEYICKNCGHIRRFRYK